MRLLIALLSLVLLSAPLHAEIVVVVAAPLSGPFVSLGLTMRNGVEQAVADINAQGGVNGERLVADALDDGCDIDKATAVANQAAGKDAKLVVGHLCSSASIAAATVYAQHDIVQITPASSNPRLTDERAGPTIFRLFHRSGDQARFAASHIRENFPGKTIVLVHDQTAYGKGLVDGLKQHLNAAGIDEAALLSYTPGERSYGDLLSKVKAESPDIVYLGGVHNDAAVIARAMRSQGLTATLMAGDALYSDEFWTAAGDAAEGTLVSYPPDPRATANAATVVERFRQRGVEPEGYALQAYAAVQAWVQAVETAGTSKGLDVAAALAAMTVDTVVGPVTFDEKGDVKKPGFVMYRWASGNVEPVQ